MIKNACVDIVAQPENPLLTIKKFANDQDAQNDTSAVSVSSGSVVNYRVVIANTSAFGAYNI